MPFGFLDVPQTVTKTSQGNVALPILYRKTSALIALFPAPYAPVASMLRGTGLEAVRLLHGNPLVALAFFRYDDTSIGPYHEAAVATVVTPSWVKAPGSSLFDLLRPARNRVATTYIFDLPVTSEVANAAGREIWGFPKFVTDIPIEFSAGRFRGTVMDPVGNAEIASLAGTVSRGIPVPGMSLALSSQLNNELIRTTIDVRSFMWTSRGKGLVLNVGESKHPMANGLRALNLDGAVPALVQFTHGFRSRLNAGERGTVN